MSDQPTTDLRPQLIARINATPAEVWTPSNFVDLGSRAAVDKTLQRRSILPLECIEALPRTGGDPRPLKSQVETSTVSGWTRMSIFDGEVARPALRVRGLFGATEPHRYDAAGPIMGVLSFGDVRAHSGRLHGVSRHEGQTLVASRSAAVPSKETSRSPSLLPHRCWRNRSRAPHGARSNRRAQSRNCRTRSSYPFSRFPLMSLR
jgi:hypothetical protein